MTSLQETMNLEGFQNQALPQRTANDNAVSFAALCSFHVYFIFWGRRSLQIRYAVHFKHGFVHAFQC